MDEKMKFKIYKIQCDSLIVKNKADRKTKINEIVNNYNADHKALESFNKQNMHVSEIDGFELALYFQSKIKKPDWLSFFKGYVDSSEEILKSENKYNSIVLFLISEDSLYAISKGQGNFLINQYVESNFGVNILSRLLDKTDNSIKYLANIQLMGSVLAEEKLYRRGSNIINEDTFGKYYKNLHAGISENNIKLLNLDKELLKQITCNASDYFLMNSSLTMKQVIKLIKQFDKILKSKSSILPNSLVEVKNKVLIGELYNNLRISMRNAIDTNNFEGFNFEIINSTNIFNFFNANKYVFQYRKSIEINDISKVSCISLLADLPNYAEPDFDFFDSVNLKAYDDSGNEVVSSKSILKCMTGELQHNNKLYFLLNSSWYEIQESFTLTLNQKLKELFDRFFLDKILPVWDTTIHKYESDYNESVGGTTEYISLDKKTREFLNIEVFDLIDISREKLRMIHVKSGFDQNMRNLTYQAEIACRLIYEDRNTDRTLGKKIYNEFGLEDKKKITEDEFINKFYNCEIEICLAIKTGSRKKLVKDVTQFDSSISKYSLIEVYKEIIAKDMLFIWTEL